MNSIIMSRIALIARCLLVATIAGAPVPSAPVASTQPATRSAIQLKPDAPDWLAAFLDQAQRQSPAAADRAATEIEQSRKEIPLLHSAVFSRKASADLVRNTRPDGRVFYLYRNKHAVDDEIDRLRKLIAHDQALIAAVKEGALVLPRSVDFDNWIQHKTGGVFVRLGGFHVQQVIDSNQMIIKLSWNSQEYNGPQLRDETFWLSGVSTDDLSDDSNVAKPTTVLVVGHRSYSTAIGQRTLMQMCIFDPEQWLLDPKSVTFVHEDDPSSMQ